MLHISTQVGQVFNQDDSERLEWVTFLKRCQNAESILRNFVIREERI
jgi:hypothetical protein